MPPEPGTRYDDIFNVLRTLTIFDENYNLKKEKDTVWSTAVRQLYPMKKHNLYIYVQQNRWDIQTQLVEYQYPGIKVKKRRGTKTKSKNKENLTNHENSDEDNENTSNDMQFEQHENSTPDECPDEYIKLIEMYYSVQYYGLIQKISIRPFSIMYWSAEQIDLYKDLVKINLPFSLLVYNGLLTRSKMINYTSESLFCFFLTCRFESITIRLAQLVSESLNSEFILNFCLEFVRNGIPLPSHINIGYHRGILNGVSEAFNKCSYSDFTLKCYENLIQNIDNCPLVIIHVDTFTILQIIFEAKCFKEKPKPVKTFYLKCILYLSTVKQLQEFEDTVLCMLSLMMNPHEDNLVLGNKLSLMEKIKTPNISTSYERYETIILEKSSESLDYLSNDMNTVFNVPKNKATNYIHDLKIRACDSNRDLKNLSHKINAYYCPQFYNDHLLILFSEFLGWTSILVEHIPVHILESSINSVLSSKSDPVTVTEFLTMDIQESKQLVQKGRSLVKTTKKIHQKVQVFHNFSYLNMEENWMGKAQCYKEINENLEDHSALEDSKLKNEDQGIGDQKVKLQLNIRETIDI